MRLDILLLAADPGARDLVLRFLGCHRVTVAAAPEEATLLLAARRYGFFLTTNFGVPAGEAIGIVPAERDYPVLFLTGFVTDQIERDASKSRSLRSWCLRRWTCSAECCAWRWRICDCDLPCHALVVGSPT